MDHHLKSLRATAFGVLVATSLIGAAALSPASAAPPDGDGPWADVVVSADQGTALNSSDISMTRTDPDAAVGPANGYGREGQFFTLGKNGSIVLGFDNAICAGASNGLQIVEATRGPYAHEYARVAVSGDGSSFVTVGTAHRGVTNLTLPAGVDRVHYVRLTDASESPRGRGDGFDVDAVRALGSTTCAATPAGPASGSSDAPKTGSGSATSADHVPVVAGYFTTVATKGAGGCVSRRNFRIHIRPPAAFAVRRGYVSIGGRRIATLTGQRLSARVRLIGLPRGRFTLKVKLVSAAGRSLTQTRRYRTCTAKRRRH